MSRATGWQAGLELYDEDGVSDEQSHHLWEETVNIITYFIYNHNGKLSYCFEIIDMP